MTLKILKDQANTLILTLSELASDELPNNWLFLFTDEQTLEVVGTLYLTDISSYTERYNEFVLIEPTDVEFTAGDFQYEVFQMPNGGSTDTDLGLLVEIGKVRVVVDEEIVSYTAQTINKKYER